MKQVTVQGLLLLHLPRRRHGAGGWNCVSTLVLGRNPHGRAER